MSDPVHQLVYLSSAARTLKADELTALLETARAHNGPDGITGLLIYHDGNFFQTLEGPRDAVETCFARIEKDPRHTGVMVLHRGSAPRRTFLDWWMGFCKPEKLSPQSREALMSLSDLVPALQAGAEMPDLAQRLAASFLGGFSDVSALARAD